MKALKTLALVSLSTLGMATVQADEPVPTQPQGVVTQSYYVESGRQRGLFGKRRYEVVQASANMQQTTPATTTQSTSSVTTTTTDERVQTQPQGVVTQGQYVETGRSRGLFGKRRYEVVQASANMQQTPPATTTQSTSSVTTTTTDGKTTPMVTQTTTGTPRRGLFGRSRSSRRSNVVMTTNSATTSTTTTPSEAKPLPQAK